MKKLVFTMLIVIIGCLVTGCATQTPPKDYHMGLVSPVKSEQMFYKNDIFEIQFLRLTNQLTFEIKNNSQQPLKIIWDNCVFTGFDSRPSRVIHWGVKYTDKEKSMAPTIIPPQSKLSEGIVPADNVYWGYNQWVVNWVIPKNFDATGKKVSLLFCYNKGEKDEYLNFEFLLSNDINEFNQSTQNLPDIKTVKYTKRGFEIITVLSAKGAKNAAFEKSRQ